MKIFQKYILKIKETTYAINQLKLEYENNPESLKRLQLLYSQTLRVYGQEGYVNTPAPKNGDEYTFEEILKALELMHISDATYKSIEKDIKLGNLGVNNKELLKTLSLIKRTNRSTYAARVTLQRKGLLARMT